MVPRAFFRSLLVDLFVIFSNLSVHRYPLKCAPSESVLTSLEVVDRVQKAINTAAYHAANYLSIGCLIVIVGTQCSLLAIVCCANTHGRENRNLSTAGGIRGRVYPAERVLGPQNPWPRRCET